MKRFVVRILIFFLIIAVIDVIFGIASRYLNSHSKGGDTYNHYFIANEMTDSVLIFGSSRAIHHYNPAILEDSLHTSVYNCGLDGQGIMFNYGRLLTIVNRYNPKMIIYDVTPKFDMFPDDYYRYLKPLRKWYDVPGVDEIFYDVNHLEKLKMRSNLYRYNDIFIQMLSDNVKPMQSISYKGFKPIDDQMVNDVTSKKDMSVDVAPLKMKYLQKFIDLCKEKNIKLIFSFSPSYKGETSPSYQFFDSIASANDIPVIDFTSNRELNYDISNFSDGAHLNLTGADRFTRMFVSKLKEKLPAAE